MAAANPSAPGCAAQQQPQWCCATVGSNLHASGSTPRAKRPRHAEGATACQTKLTRGRWRQLHGAGCVIALVDAESECAPAMERNTGPQARTPADALTRRSAASVELTDPAPCGSVEWREEAAFICGTQPKGEIPMMIPVTAKLAFTVDWYY